ncbi:MAG: sigma-70 family RNA polymerase sigma factor [Blastocatellia bacterium]|nr:sigma-70 family RNA polymerase sigma factor [Blastocatellia bacterium]MBL8197070.1 sigma-70 family RNA polymerase sigma factor [Blastocatellia bacterium]MBN8722403.1 sigma-70 family RNA polymerase sigma factor [Acidobacteriota bacterium]
MSNTVTILLEKWQKGNQEALSELIPIIYKELHRLANHYLRAERSNHTLQTTALINEAFISLLEDNNNFANRSHFMAIAANTMRRVLVDYARKKNAQKRQGEVFAITLTGIAKSIMTQDIDLLVLEQALSKLETIDPMQVKIVELRFFCGLTIEETAAILGISATSVKTDWAMAKAWLHRELS